MQVTASAVRVGAYGGGMTTSSSPSDPVPVSLPPIVVADLFGMHPNTAQKWANYAKDD